MKRLLPRTLTAQLMWLIAIALVAANLLTLALLAMERREALRDARRIVELQRVAALVPGLSLLDDASRRRIVRATSRRSLRLSLSDRPAIRGRPRSQRLERRFAAEVGEPLEDVRIAVLGRRGPQRVNVVASVLLPEGVWLNARIRRAPEGTGRAGLAVMATAGLSLVFALAVVFAFLRRITAPIRALTSAAERAGEGDREARVEPSGSEETRAAGRAFNDMQGAIARFDVERARTVAAVGHDLRTPITSLRIRAEMLDEDTAAPMIRTLDEMRVMADDLLEWGRAEGEPKVETDLTALLVDICSEHENATFEADTAAMLQARPVALRRAFANVIDNALRYGGNARVRQNGRTVIIEDDGPGIPDADMAAMLEPFSRGDASRAAHTGGAGLGLSIAHRIVRAHGGTLDMANRKGGGLSVTVTLSE